MEKNIERLPNNVIRKKLYHKLWRTCDLGDTVSASSYRVVERLTRWKEHGVHGCVALTLGLNV